MTVAIRYVDGPRPAPSLLADADWVAVGREEVIRINVFPVPDGDTGTNFSLTLRSVADALRALGDTSLGATAHTVARGAVLGPRGNSGMMLAGDILKIHVHTDVPDAVFTCRARWETIGPTKAKDMRAAGSGWNASAIATELRRVRQPLSAHVGLGAWTVFWQVEDGTPSHLGGA